MQKKVVGAVSSPSSLSPLSIMLESPASSSSGSLVATPAQQTSPAVIVSIDLETPCKKARTESRTSHLGKVAPPEHDMDLLEASLGGVAVSAAAQHLLAASAPGPTGVDLLSLPVYDREMPANFAEAHKQLYIRLPELCLPQPGIKLVGKANFTVYSSDKTAAVQVQLANKCFFCIRDNGLKWDKVKGSPTVNWHGFPNLEDAWAAATAKVSWS